MIITIDSDQELGEQQLTELLLWCGIGISSYELDLNSNSPKLIESMFRNSFILRKQQDLLLTIRRSHGFVLGKS